MSDKPASPAQISDEPQRCKDCDDCARRAYSDATTPGFFYDECEKHRKPAGSRLEPIEAVSTTPKCKCVGEMHDEGCRCSCTDYTFDLLCLIHRKPKVSTPLPQQGWVDCPDSQGWWWHFYDGAAVPYPYGILWSGTGNRYFIQYPDSRWCDEVGGKWLKIETPEVPK